MSWLSPPRRRSRHSGGLGTLVSRMFKDELEWAKGRLNRFSSGYIFSDAGCTNKQGVFLGPHSLSDGRLVSLTLKPAVNNCPKPPISDPVPNERLSNPDQAYFWVPYQDCLKCEHHKRHTYTKRSQGRCLLLQSLRAGHKVGSSTLNIVNSAMKNVKEILK